ncbi:hypothetical protein AB833_03290 [Chromatiales bacterium (ex Bugula neritina AB1)]|nr:hypothetical protein AB833_03290 [Chromatiales bacterium (ex Bugula neritina AB1)]
MFGKIVFSIAVLLYLCSLFSITVIAGEENMLTGIETFFYTLRYGTAGLFGAHSTTDVVVNFIALVAAAANFVFIFWAMLVFLPTKITALKWFWWTSLLFLIAAIYTGIQALLSDRVALANGYYLWIAALVLMLVAPVVRRYERRRMRQLSVERVDIGTVKHSSC